MTPQPNHTPETDTAEAALTPPQKPKLEIRIKGPETPAIDLMRSLLTAAPIEEALSTAYLPHPFTVLLETTTAKSPSFESVENGCVVSLPLHYRDTSKTTTYLREGLLRFLVKELAVRTACSFVTTGEVTQEARTNLIKLVGEQGGTVIDTDLALQGALSKVISPYKDELFERRDSLIKKIRKHNNSSRTSTPTKAIESLTTLTSLFTKLRAISLLIDTPGNQAQVGDLAESAVRDFSVGLTDLWTSSVFNGDHNTAEGAIKVFRTLASDFSRSGFQRDIPLYLRQMEAQLPLPTPRPLSGSLLNPRISTLGGRASPPPLLTRETVHRISQLPHVLQGALELDREFRAWSPPSPHPEHASDVQPMDGQTIDLNLMNAAMDLTPLVPAAIKSLVLSPNSPIPNDLKDYIQILALRRLHGGETGATDYLFIVSGELPTPPGAARAVPSYDQQLTRTRDYLGMLEFLSSWERSGPSERAKITEAYFPTLKVMTARAIVACLSSYAGQLPTAAIEDPERVRQELPIIRRDLARLREADECLRPQLFNRQDLGAYERTTSQLLEGLTNISDTVEISALGPNEVRQRIKELPDISPGTPFAEQLQALRDSLLNRVNQHWDASVAEALLGLEQSFEIGDPSSFTTATTEALSLVATAPSPEKAHELVKSTHTMLFQMVTLIHDGYDFEIRRLEQASESHDGKKPTINDVYISLNALALSEQDLSGLGSGLEPYKEIVDPLILRQLAIFGERPRKMFTLALLRHRPLLAETLRDLNQKLSQHKPNAEHIACARELNKLDLPLSRLDNPCRQLLRAFQDACRGFKE